MKASKTSMKYEMSRHFSVLLIENLKNKQTKDIFLGITSFYRKFGILGFISCLIRVDNKVPFVFLELRVCGRFT